MEFIRCSLTLDAHDSSNETDALAILRMRTVRATNSVLKTDNIRPQSQHSKQNNSTHIALIKAHKLNAQYSHCKLPFYINKAH